MVSSELVKAHVEWNKISVSNDDEEMDGLLGSFLGHKAGEFLGKRWKKHPRIGGFVGGAAGHILGYFNPF